METNKQIFSHTDFGYYTLLFIVPGVLKHALQFHFKQKKGILYRYKLTYVTLLLRFKINSLLSCIQLLLG